MRKPRDAKQTALTTGQRRFVVQTSLILVRILIWQIDVAAPTAGSGRAATGSLDDAIASGVAAALWIERALAGIRLLIDVAGLDRAHRIGVLCAGGFVHCRAALGVVAVVHASHHGRSA